jgi:hypothetical protein
VLGDTAYSDGDVRQAVEQLGVKMVAKVPPVNNGRHYPKTDFYFELDRGEVTCPAGEVTKDARPANDHKRRPARRFAFSAEQCAACPLRPECTGAAARTVRVRPAGAGNRTPLSLRRQGDQYATVSRAGKKLRDLAQLRRYRRSRDYPRPLPGRLGW